MHVSSAVPLADELGARDALDFAEASANSVQLARLLPFGAEWAEHGIRGDQGSLARAAMVIKRHLALAALVRECLAGMLLAVLDLALAS